MSHITFILHKNYISQNLAQVIFSLKSKSANMILTLPEIISLIDVLFHFEWFYFIFTDVQKKDNPKKIEIVDSKKTYI